MPRGGKRINFRKFGKVESYYAWVRWTLGEAHHLAAEGSAGTK